ncbi:hypothetical protein H4R20_000478 [Coemansia guatemalensis]|uniref:Uncharacterized protein n=1 Tax=Coemansia guatemalensis TaxID=2761395 RepID=A0A9W8LVE1_9FUNG|nr:hypothetical protein H4R20_000478 [Coemansia guatemalensis]
MSHAPEQSVDGAATGGLLSFIESCAVDNIEVDVPSFKEHLRQVYSAKEDMIAKDIYLNTMEYLSQLQTMSIDDAFKLLDILFPQSKNITANDGHNAEDEQGETTAAGYTGNIIDSYEENVNIQKVPDADTRVETRSEVPNTSLDTRSRRRTSPVRRYQTSSTAEGSRLRGRNRAVMSNEEYDALASNIQPGLVDDIATYAAQAGIGPSHSADSAAGEQTQKDYPTLSDPVSYYPLSLKNVYSQSCDLLAQRLITIVKLQ